MPSTRRDVNPCSVGQHSNRCAATAAPLSDQIGRAATFGELLSFRLSVGPAHDEAVGVVVVLQQLSQDTEGLHRQLSRWRQDDDAGAVPGHELQLVDELNGRYEESQGLARASLGSTDQISTL